MGKYLDYWKLSGKGQGLMGLKYVCVSGMRSYRFEVCVCVCIVWLRQQDKIGREPGASGAGRKVALSVCGKLSIYCLKSTSHHRIGS